MAKDFPKYFWSEFVMYRCRWVRVRRFDEHPSWYYLSNALTKYVFTELHEDSLGVPKFRGILAKY